uniref:Uncharacterized protein n=1 Tax=Rhabditophanes sp. KR3021 TaxID=114890 RepID=A0AC35U2M0_9BILA
MLDLIITFSLDRLFENKQRIHLFIHENLQYLPGLAIAEIVGQGSNKDYVEFLTTMISICASFNYLAASFNFIDFGRLVHARSLELLLQREHKNLQYLSELAIAEIVSQGSNKDYVEFLTTMISICASFNYLAASFNFIDFGRLVHARSLELLLQREHKS